MEIAVVYPHQLFADHPVLAPDRPVFLIEEPLVYGCDRRWQLRHHARRQALLREAGVKYVERLRAEGYVVEVIELEPGGDSGVISGTYEMLNRVPGEVVKVHVARVVDDLLERRLRCWAEERSVEIVWYETPNFVTPDDWWRGYFEGKKKPFMAHFYQAQRKRMGVLVDQNGKPVGGRWSYDDENRKKLPKGYQEPQLPQVGDFSDETKVWVCDRFPDAWGEVSGGLPVNHAQAEEWLEVFLRERFALFGDYEDAISRSYATQQHSVLTPMLNIGLLDPGKVVERAIDFAIENDVPLNSLEGFVRQVIGWREFMRCMYELYGREMRVANFWGFEHDVPLCFSTGKTGLPPVDTVIRQLHQTGYCHHIERLMVMGVIFQLCHIEPTAVYRWFMEMFIDAYDWVMVPNVYGMSQFADGGVFVTKPYVCGSNYIRKMSDYGKGEWCDIWDGLFWDFIASHRDFYQNQPRLGMMTRQLDKMGADKLTAHQEMAAAYREKIHSGWECDCAEDEPRLF